MVIKDKTRDEIDEKMKWDLSKIYSNLDDWQKDFDYILNKQDDYLKFKGKLNNSENILKFFT